MTEVDRLKELAAEARDRHDDARAACAKAERKLTMRRRGVGAETPADLERRFVSAARQARETREALKLATNQISEAERTEAAERANRQPDLAHLNARQRAIRLRK